MYNCSLTVRNKRICYVKIWEYCVRSITSELDMLSRTGKVDFCQLNKQQLSRSVQSLKQKNCYTKRCTQQIYYTGSFKKYDWFCNEHIITICYYTIMTAKWTPKRYEESDLFFKVLIFSFYNIRLILCFCLYLVKQYITTLLLFSWYMDRPLYCIVDLF